MITSKSRNSAAATAATTTNASGTPTATTIKFNNNSFNTSTSSNQQKNWRKNYKKFQVDVDLASTSDLDEYTSSSDALNGGGFLKAKQFKSVDSSVDNNSNSILNDEATTNIFYVKQKYKMYLDWLSENYNGARPTVTVQQQQQQKLATNPQIINNIKNVNNNFFNNIIKPSQSAVDVNALNWYKFESSVLNPDIKYTMKQQQQQQQRLLNPKNDYFSNITNKLLPNRQQQQQQQPIAQVQLPIPQLPQIARSRSIGKISPVNTKTKQQRRTDGSLENSALSVRQNNSALDEYFEVHSNNKAVKFDSNLLTESVKMPANSTSKHKSVNSVNQRTPAGTVSNQPLKPILKSSASNNNNDLLLKQMNNSQQSTPSDGQTPFDSNSRQLFTSRNSAKLPPLTDCIKQKQNCSDDFLAVINDLETSRLV